MQRVAELKETGIGIVLPAWVFPLLIGIIIVLLPMLGIPCSTQRQVQHTWILALVGSGLNLSLGYAGELALGQPAVYAAGAYTAGLMSKAGHTEILVQLAAGALAALVVGLITGVPGLRLGGWSLAMTSFFIVLLLPDVLAIFKEVTGGRNGLSGITPPTLFGQRITDDMLFIVVALVVVVWFVIVRNIIVSRHGVAGIPCPETQSGAGLGTGHLGVPDEAHGLCARCCSRRLGRRAVRQRCPAASSKCWRLGPH